MIRRIILFLGLLLWAFFAYRRYDQAAADQLLSKVKSFSFNKSSYTTYSEGNAISDTTSDTISLPEETDKNNNNTSDEISSDTIPSSGESLVNLLIAYARRSLSTITTGWDITNDEIVGELVTTSTDDDESNESWMIPPCPNCDIDKIISVKDTITTIKEQQKSTVVSSSPSSKSVSPSNTTSKTTTTSSTTKTTVSTTNNKLSDQDLEDAEDFFQALSKE